MQTVKFIFTAPKFAFAPVRVHAEWRTTFADEVVNFQKCRCQRAKSNRSIRFKQSEISALPPRGGELCIMPNYFGVIPNFYTAYTERKSMMKRFYRSFILFYIVKSQFGIKIYADGCSLRLRTGEKSSRKKGNNIPTAPIIKVSRKPINSPNAPAINEPSIIIPTLTKRKLAVIRPCK